MNIVWGLLLRFGAWLLGGVVALIPTVIGQALISLGIGVVTYAGVDTTLSFLKSFAVGYLTSLPAGVLGLLSIMQVGVCISMVTSAYTARLVLDGMTNGSFKRWIKK